MKTIKGLTLFYYLIFNVESEVTIPPLLIFKIRPKLDCQASQNPRQAGDSGCLKSAKNLSESLSLTLVMLTLR